MSTCLGTITPRRGDITSPVSDGSTGAGNTTGTEIIGVNGIIIIITMIMTTDAYRPW